MIEIKVNRETGEKELLNNEIVSDKDQSLQEFAKIIADWAFEEGLIELMKDKKDKPAA